MDNNKLKTLIFALCCIIFCLLIVCTVSYKKVHQNEEKVVNKTIYLKDTIYIPRERIKMKEKEVEVIRYDTIRIQDTLFVEVPISRYEYLDTIKTDSSSTKIGIEYEGYKAKINSISIESDFHPNIDIFVPEEKKVKFGHSLTVGLQAGYGFGIQSRQFEPYVGVGVGYGFGIMFKR